ncbi:hypothetical protein PRK78_004222 [Emydomyces testavorans]|uniref:Uncharacterized protein n=1 Tax=Emydomyces testavorans TaxID=2070801 RepID=A0AAF0ILE7_9EURO|nr:hypothetical protein PRK78_004222 [Emydomyces testavorans]
MSCCEERKFGQNDLLRPKPKESSRIFLHSLKTWRSLLFVAQSTTRFPDSCINIRNVLHNTPAIPDSSGVTETAEGNCLLLNGYSLWKIHSISDCELNTKLKRSQSQAIVIGELQPTYCKLSNEFLLKWSGLDTTPNTPQTGNYLCVFVLGWAYILSARLLELRRENDADKLSYTDSRAILSAMNPTTHDCRFLIPVGDADEQELRWWAAILAKGCGWQATLTRGGRTYFSPWACYLDDDRPLTVLHNGLKSTSAYSLEPPSSTQAQSYLLRLAQMHNAVDQLIAAFMATLTIPRRQRFGAPI